MKAIVLVPGAEGSELFLKGEEIWPPTVYEILFGYHRVAKLMDEELHVGSVIRSIGPKGIYKILIQDLECLSQATGAIFYEFSYDWRRDNVAYSAPKLAAFIEERVAPAADDITIVAHSMGGLVARLVIEGGEHDRKTWFKSIKKLVGICVPNKGAVSALTKALGMEGIPAVTGADTARLMADHRYPAGYELLPAVGTHVVYEPSTGAWIDIYSRQGAARLSLDLQNLQLAEAEFGKLDLSNGGSKVKYIFISGAGQKTEEAIEIENRTVLSVVTDYAGDGTVPLWSADSAQVERYVVAGDHIDIFGTGPFRERLYAIVGGAQVEIYKESVAPISISINKWIFSPGEEISIILISSYPLGSISGGLSLKRSADSSGSAFSEFHQTPINYQGPLVAEWRFVISAPTAAGVYLLEYSDSDRLTNLAAVQFYVSKQAGQKYKLK